MVCSYGFGPHLSEKQRAAVDKLLSIYDNDLFSPPEWEDACGQAGIRPENAGEILTYMLEQGLLIRAGAYLFSAKAPEEVLSRMKANNKEEGFTAGDIRSLLGCNRKYTLALLEYTDAHKITVRAGDLRYCGE